jgi:hypothetical protein
MASNSRQDLEEHLTEDPVISSQEYFVLSYILANPEIPDSFPLIKVRGSYRTMEECQKRIETLKNIDPYFNLYVASVGKWGSLLPAEKVMNMSEVDVVYHDKTMNTMMSEYKKNKEAQQEVFEQRMQRLKSGQGSSGEMESLEDVELRAKSLQEQIDDLTSKLEEVKVYKERTDADILKMKKEA